MKKRNFKNVCVICGKVFQPKCFMQITCCKDCSKENAIRTEKRHWLRLAKFRKCLICGTEFLSIKGRKSCSEKCLKELKFKHFMRNDFSDEYVRFL